MSSEGSKPEYRLPASSTPGEDDFVSSATPDPSSIIVPLYRLPSTSISTSENEEFGLPATSSSGGGDGFIPSATPEPSSIIVPLYRRPVPFIPAEDDDLVPSGIPTLSSPGTLDCQSDQRYSTAYPSSVRLNRFDMASTIDISPSYALDDPSDLKDDPSDLKDDIDLTNPTQVINLPPDFNLSKFQIDYLEAPETRGSAKREIKNLAESLEDHFAKVSTEMEELDRAELIQDRNGKLILYLPKWQELHNEFTRLTLDSQRYAIAVKAKIDQLVYLVLPEIEKAENPIETKESLTAYIKSLSEFGKTSDDNSLRFTHLRQNIESFKSLLTRHARFQLDRVEAQIREIDENIRKLESEVKVPAHAISVFRGIFSPKKKEGSDGSDIDITTVAGARSLFKMAPEVEIGLMFATLNAIAPEQAAKAKEILQQQIGTLKNVTDLTIRSSAVRFLEEEVRLVFEYVGKLEPVFKGMVGKLATIHEVYRMILADCGELETCLCSMKETENSLLFQRLLNLVKATYATFSIALEDYCHAIIN